MLTSKANINLDKRETIHIAIVEPSQIIMEGLHDILQKIKSKYRLSKYYDCEELIRPSIKEGIDIIIVNPVFVQFNKKNFAHIKRSNPHVKWVGLIYSFFDKETIGLFDSTIQITDTPGTIDFAIDQLLKTETLIEDESKQGEQLSDREVDVLLNLVHGLSNKEIADKLNISTHTVVSHRKNIIQKTGIKSQSGLTIYAISNKLISLDDF